jgi:hypothetical protein
MRRLTSHNISKMSKSLAGPQKSPVCPPLVPAKPPDLNRLDHWIRQLKNESTSILELSEQRMQLVKRSHCPDMFVRVEELVREVGRLRQEVMFYRAGFENLQRLRETAYDVYQQIFLAHYLDHNRERLNELMNQLHQGLQDSVRREVKAEKAWMEFWGFPFSEKEFDGGLVI